MIESVELGERLTWQQICAQYPDAWVVLVDFDWLEDNDAEYRTARVVGHGSTRQDATEQSRRLGDRFPSRGCAFTGPLRAPQRSYPP